MADEIVSKLGFSCEDAIASLSRLDSALARSASSFQTYATVLGQFNSGATSASTVMANLGNSAKNLASSAASVPAAMNNANNAVQKVNTSTKSLFISWETMVRVMSTQAIVRGMNMVRDSFEFAFDSAMKFSTQVGEIAAINPERNFATIAANLRQLSDSFNQPLSRVAEAQYQVISDQFASAADQANILTAANTLAKVSNQDLADTSMLLTGALNAYGESSDMAGIRAAQFFKTVELGRLRMSELGQAMGRTQGLGSELGVSMEELQAGLISITIGGVKAAEAATQLRGVMSALIKPSEDMKKALASIGASSGEEAIKIYGLQGTLQKLWEVSGQTATGMSQIFRNIRGDIGALRIAGEGAEKYAAGLREVSKIRMSELQGKEAIFRSSDAEKLSTELNKIKNFFTAELGPSLIKGTSSFAQFSGKVAGTVPVLRTMTDTISTLAPAIMLGAVAWGAVAAQQQLSLMYATNIKATIVTMVALLPAVVSSVQQAGAAWADMQASRGIKTAELMQQQYKDAKEFAELDIKLTNDTNKEKFQKLRQLVAESKELRTSDRSDIESSLKIEEKLTEQSFDRIMSQRRKMTQDLGRIAEDAAKNAAEVPQQIVSQQTKNSDRAFDLKTSKGSVMYQYAQNLEQATTLASKAMQLQATATTDEEVKAAQAVWQRADNYTRVTTEIGEQIGTIGALNQVEELALSIEGKKIQALTLYGEKQKEVAQEASKRQQEALRHDEELNREQLKLRELLKPTEGDTAQGFKLKSPEKFKEDLAAYDKGVADFVQHLATASADFTKNFDAGKINEELRRQAELSIATYGLTSIQVTPDAMRNLYSQLDTDIGKMTFKIKIIGELATATGKDLISSTPTEIIDAAEKRQAELTALVRQEEAANRGISSAQTAYGVARAGLQPFVEGARRQYTANKPEIGDTTPNGENLVQYAMRMDKLSQATRITDKELKEFQQLSLDTMATLPDSPKLAGYFEASLKAIEQLKQAQDDLTNARKTPEATESERKITELLGTNKGLLSGINSTQKDLTNSEQASVDPINAATTATYGQVSAAAALESSWWGVASAKAAASATTSGEESSYSFEDYMTGSGWNSGGMQHLASGGVARGMDTRSAMLTPGEVVVNPSSSRKWFSQLMAMNAGQSPVYRGSGGDTSISIGDINVNGASQPRETAREVVKSVKRELRRGTSKF